jgi:hypothetical protein
MFTKIFFVKLEGKTPLGRPSCRWDNIKLDLRDRVWCVDRIHVFRTGAGGGIL